MCVFIVKFCDVTIWSYLFENSYINSISCLHFKVGVGYFLSQLLQIQNEPIRIRLIFMLEKLARYSLNSCFDPFITPFFDKFFIS